MSQAARQSFLAGLGLLAWSGGALAPALAQDQRTVEVIGMAEPLCNLGEIAQGQGPQLNIDVTSGAVFTVTELMDSATLTSKAAAISLEVPATCNTIHRVALASDNNGLWRTIPAGGGAGFASAIPYAAELSWSDQDHRLEANATSRGYIEEGVVVGQPATGDILIEFSINAGATNAGVGAPLLAGEYADVLRVIVEAQ